MFLNKIFVKASFDGLVGIHNTTGMRSRDPGTKSTGSDGNPLTFFAAPPMIGPIGGKFSGPPAAPGFVQERSHCRKSYGSRWRGPWGRWPDTDYPVWFSAPPDPDSRGERSRPTWRAVSSLVWSGPSPNTVCRSVPRSGPSSSSASWAASPLFQVLPSRPFKCSATPNGCSRRSTSRLKT
jgi:hypothetical protein